MTLNTLNLHPRKIQIISLSMFLIGTALQTEVDRWYYHSHVLTDSTESIAGSDTKDIFRVVPLTETLNSVANNIVENTILKLKNVRNTENKFSLIFTKDQKKDIFIEYNFQDFLSFLHINRLENAYLSKNTDDEIVLTQLLQLQEKQICYSYFKACHVKVIGFENVFKLNININTTFDNTDCVIHSVTLTGNSSNLRLAVEGVPGYIEFFETLFYSLTEDYDTSAMSIISTELLPYFKKSVEEINICTIFDDYSKEELNLT